MKNHFCGHGFIVPSGVLKINPSRLRPCARTLVVMLPFLYEAMPAFMYICGIVSFSLSFKVTLGIFTFFGALESVVVASVEVPTDVFGLVEDVDGDVDDAAGSDVCLIVVDGSIVVWGCCVLLATEPVNKN